ncbi:MAG: glycoside hydrolase family 38 C-terminal domain-containing protein [Trueperaceae bacterium]|nr:glycoside hydrolase family 38 C-terminal domain-containing protein [Trueperaceae bacterium]
MTDPHDPRNPAQRLAHLRARLGDLRAWRVRDAMPLGHWRATPLGGEPVEIAAGDPWPTREGVVGDGTVGDGLVAFDRHTVTFPADWPLADVRLELDAGGEGLALVHSKFGKHAFGLDPYHRELAVPALAFGLRLEAVARRPFGEPVPDPRFGVTRLLRLDRDVEALATRLAVVAEAVDALLAGGRDAEAVDALLDAADAALHGLHLPSATEALLPRLAARGAFARGWTPPADFGDPLAPLGEDARARARAADERLRALLHAARAALPPRGRVAAVGHAHIDLAWLWPVDETRRKVRRTFGTVLGLLDEREGWAFGQSSAALHAWYAADEPEGFARLRARVANGRWEVLGGTWVEHETAMSSGESMARQLLHGQRWFERHLGVRARIGWLPDCFGFSPALPQLLRSAGIDAFVTTKTNWNDTNRLPYDQFRWEGLDGSSVVAHTFENPSDNYNAVLGPASVLETWRRRRPRAPHPETLLSFGYGDGGGGPTRAMLDAAAAMAELPALPELVLGRVDAFVERLTATATERPLPTWRGELYFELHRGTLTSQARTKRGHRLAEARLVEAEALAGLAAFLEGAPAPDLDEAWTRLLTVQFHDVLPGSSVREVATWAEAELADVQAAAEAVAADAAERLARSPTGDVGTHRWMLANPTLAERPARALLPLDAHVGQAVAGGRAWVGRAPIAPLARDVRTLETTDDVVVATPERLANRRIEARFDAHGELIALRDLERGADLLVDGGHRLWVFPDHPRAWDAWDVEAGYDADGVELTGEGPAEVVEAGPLRGALRVVRTFRDSRIVQTYRLWADAARLDVATEIDWHERRWLLQARVPVAVRAERATFECAHGVLTRPTHRNTPWDAAMFEAPVHRWLDLSEPGRGVALLNDGRYGAHVHGHVLALSLLRSPVWPDARADEGHHEVTYALLAHGGDPIEAGVLAEADDLHAPLRARPTARPAGVARVLVAEGVPLALSGFKPAADGDGWVLRTFEPRGARGTVRWTAAPGWTNAGPVSVLEEPIEAGDALGPFAVRAWRWRKG